MRRYFIVPVLVTCAICVSAFADSPPFCGPHVGIVQAPKESQFYPKFPCHSRIETAVATVHLVIGVDGHIQEAQVVKVEVTPPEMESCAADLAHAEALLLRYSKPAQVCGTTIRLRFTSGGP